MKLANKAMNIILHNILRSDTFRTAPFRYMRMNGDEDWIFHTIYSHTSVHMEYKDANFKQTKIHYLQLISILNMTQIPQASQHP